MTETILPINLLKHSQRDTYPLGNGDLAVRPGLRELYTPPSSTEIVGAFSLRTATTGDLWHYVVDTTTNKGAQRVTTIRVLDYNFTEFQALIVSSTRKPRIVTHAEVLGELMICSPDFPTVFGQVGGGLSIASKVASDNSGTTALEVPRGLVVAWADRDVIADGAGIYISDPRVFSGGSLRTFVAANAQWRPGVVYGLHVAAGGSLVACTTEGVYALPVSAAAAGQVAIGAWQLVSTHRTYDYGTTCHARGRVYGLTQNGIRVIDTEEGSYIPLDEPIAPRAYGARINRDDWRNATTFPLADGPCIASGLVGNPWHMVDAPRGFRAWWSPATGVITPGAAVGTLRHGDGEELIACAGGVYRVVGDFDGALPLSISGNAIKGYVIGQIPMEPRKSLTAISMTVGAGYNAGAVLSSFRGDAQGAGTGNRGTPGGIIIEQSEWDQGITYEEVALQSRWAKFKARQSDDFAFECGAEYGQTRLAPQASIVIEGIDEDREIDR